MRSFEVIRCNGQREKFQVEGSGLNQAVCEKIGAKVLDFVTLEVDRAKGVARVMAVDDDGYEYVVVEKGPGHFAHEPTRARKPVNPIATSLYHERCKPGVTHQIVGDVAIFWDSIY